MNSSSKVIKLKKSITHAINVSDVVLEQMNDPDLKKLIDEKIERARKKGYKEGYDAGTAEATENEQQKFSAATQLVHNCVQEMNSYLDQLYKEIEAEVVCMVMTVCEVIVRRELSKPNEVSNIIKDAIKKVSEYRSVIMRIHPSAGTYFEQIVDALKEQNLKMEQINIVIDREVGEGGCRIETDTSVVDACIEKIFHEIREKVEELIQWELPAGQDQ